MEQTARTIDPRVVEYECIFAEVADVVRRYGEHASMFTGRHMLDDVELADMSDSPAGPFSALSWKEPPGSSSSYVAYLRPGKQLDFGHMCRCDFRGGSKRFIDDIMDAMRELRDRVASAPRLPRPPVKAEEPRIPTSTWVPMTDPGDVAALTKLVEELGEAVSAAARCLAQGIAESEPTTGRPNREWLEDEIADVRALTIVVMQRFSLDAGRIAERQQVKWRHKTEWIGALDEKKDTH